MMSPSNNNNYLSPTESHDPIKDTGTLEEDSASTDKKTVVNTSNSSIAVVNSEPATNDDPLIKPSESLITDPVVMENNGPVAATEDSTTKEHKKHKKHKKHKHKHKKAATEM